MSGGEPGLHGIQGIGDGSKFLVDLDEVDEEVGTSSGVFILYEDEIAVLTAAHSCAPPNDFLYLLI